MKKLFMAALALFFMTACSKNDPLQQEMSNLAGKWALKQISGGFAGTGYEADFTHLTMSNQNRYTLQNNAGTVQQGGYTLIAEDDQLVIRFQPDVPDQITFDEFEKTASLSAENRQLSLTEPCCDLFAYVFERTNE